MRTRRREYETRRQNRRNRQNVLEAQPEQPQPEPPQPEPPQSTPSPTASPQVQPQVPQQESPVTDTADVSLKDALNKLYTDINSVPSYSAKINDFLRQNNVHSVHKRILKKKFPRRKIIARFPFDIWMGDLIEYPKLKYNNRQYVYILILIDCFTKKVYAAPMRSKNMEWAVKAFESIFHQLDEFPTHIVTDGGLGETIFTFVF